MWAVRATCSLLKGGRGGKLAPNSNTAQKSASDPWKLLWAKLSPLAIAEFSHVGSDSRFTSNCNRFPSNHHRPITKRQTPLF